LLELEPQPALAKQKTTRPPFRDWLARLDALLLRSYSIQVGSLIFMLAFIVSAAFGILRQMLFNAQFGTGLDAAAYYAAFRLPETISTLIAGGTLANAMIPVLLGVARTRDRQAAQQLASLVLNTLLAVVLPLVLLAIATAPLFVRYVLAPGFAAETAALATALTRIMLLELLLVVFTGVAVALLSAENRFLLPAIAIASGNLTLIGGILLAMRFPTIGVYGPAVGSIGDVLLHSVILSYGLYRTGYRYRLHWHPRDPNLRAVVRLLIPNGLSGGVNYAGTIVDTAFASLARSTAAIPALYNAFLLIGLPQRLLGIAIAQAVFPRLAAYAVAQDWRRMRRTLLLALAAALFLSLVTVPALALGGRQIISLLFERGRFDVAAGTLTFQLLLIYLAGLPGFIFTELLTRGLIALRDTRTPLITNCLQLAGRIALIPLWLPALDVLAIPLAFAVTSAAEAALLGGVLRHKLRRQRTA
jgi:putative peptidoglycan lipid II flippase